MGIRIKKRLGYALTDVKVGEGNSIEDDRFTEMVRDPEQFYEWLYSLHEVKEEFHNWVFSRDIEDIEAYMENVPGINPLTLKVVFQHNDREEIESNRFHRLVVHQREFGLPNVFMLQPFNYPDWTRHDNILDYYEAGEPDYTVQDLTHRCGIWPFDGTMVRYPDRETPEKFLPDDGPEGRLGLRQGRLDASTYNILTGRFSENSKPKATGELLEHLLTDWNCVIPPQVLLFAKWAGIFTDFNTVYRLKPCIYTYWT